MYKEMHSYTSPINLSHLAFSHRRYLAAAAAAKVQVFNDAHLGHTTTPYLQQKCNSLVSDLQFCPYEDVLGIGTQTGFVSILVPGNYFLSFSQKNIFFRSWGSEYWN